MMKVNTVNIYDFDHTVYNGDASIDFIIYCLRRHPKLWKYLFPQAIAIVKYVLGAATRKQIKQVAFSFLGDVNDIDSIIEAFWKKHDNKIATWYKQQQNTTDIIISASPEFLLQPVARQLGIGTVLATKMNKQTGEIAGENCRSKEKVKRLHLYNKNVEVGKCYSDSLSDIPILELAKHAYIVKKEKIVKLASYKKSHLSSFKNLAFIRFLFVGGLNALLGVLFSYIVSKLIDSAVLAFVLGYSASLVVSYFLNSVITFRNYNFSFKQFVSFVISYIPNFIIQLICVYVLIDTLNVYPLIAYIIAVVVAVPLTFLLLSKRTFKGGSKT